MSEKFVMNHSDRRYECCSASMRLRNVVRRLATHIFEAWKPCFVSETAQHRMAFDGEFAEDFL